MNTSNKQNNNQQSQTNKKELLQKEFKNLDVKLDEVISTHQLKQIIDKKLGGNFQNEVFNQFCQRMQSENKQQVTVNRFIDALLEADKILNDKIFLTRTELHNLKKLRKQTCIQMEEDRRYEISDESKVVIKVGRGEIDRYLCSLPVVVQIQVENQEERTSEARGPMIQWDESLIFNISTGSEDILITLLDREHTVLAVNMLSIKEFGDQNVHQNQLQLLDDGRQVVGQLHLQIQWIHSKVKAYLKHLQVLDHQILDFDNDLVEYNRDLDIILEPFPCLKDDHSTSQQKYYNNLGNSQYFNNKYVEQPVQHSNDQKWNDMGAIISLVFVVLILLAGFFRTYYIDAVLLAAYFAFYSLHKLTRPYIKFTLLLLLLATLFDIIWFIIFYHHYSQNKNLNSIDYQIEKYTVEMSVAVMIGRVVLGLFYLLLLTRQSNNNKQNNLDTQQSSHHQQQQYDQFGEEQDSQVRRAPPNNNYY